MFEQLLGAELGAFTDNQAYAQAMAAVIMSHVDDKLYSDLPTALVPYRATVDIFLSLATENTAHKYLRAIAIALHMPRRPARFRRAVCAQANQFRLDVPAHLYKNFGADTFSAQIKCRFPDSISEDLKIRAASQGTTVSDYIREAVYARMHSENIDAKREGNNDTNTKIS